MSLLQSNPKKILIRSTNWIGDAIMTTPAIRTIRQNFPQAEISVLVNPWVADVFTASSHVDNIILYNKKTTHSGVAGMWRLSRELRQQHFDMAILLQNAFEAALLVFAAGIKVRAGYKRDGRQLLLSHGITIPQERRKKHQVHYYQELLTDLGLKKGSDKLFLDIPKEDREWATYLTDQHKGAGKLIGLNPGAAFGPAKRWPAEKYGELAAQMWKKFKAVSVVFGTEADHKAARIISEECRGKCLDMTGKTSLMRAMALIEACDAFVTNDSGLMHVAAALQTPLAAIFGSTDHIATGPFSEKVAVVRKSIHCSPCMKTHCKTDFECMESVSVDDVLVEVGKLLKPRDMI